MSKMLRSRFSFPVADLVLRQPVLARLDPVFFSRMAHHANPFSCTIISSLPNHDWESVFSLICLTLNPKSSAGILQRSASFNSD
jgi:hypothetical protein